MNERKKEWTKNEVDKDTFKAYILMFKIVLYNIFLL